MPELLQAEPGFIIHSREYREHSRLLEVFSLNCGRITLLARLGRRGGRLQALLQPLQPLKFSFIKGRSEIWTLSGCELSGEPFALKVPLAFCAAYLNELLYYLLKHYDPAPELFAQYISTLRELSAGGSAELALRRFELALLRQQGLALDFHLPDGSAFAPEGRYSFSLSSGFTPSFDDNPAEESLCYAGVLLRQAAAGDFSSAPVRRMLKELTRLCLRQLLGSRELRSRQLYLNYLRSIR